MSDFPDARGVHAETIAADGTRKRLTLDAIAHFPITLDIREVADPPITAGFQLQWGECDTPKGTLELNCGAGVGSQYATISWQGRHFVFDANQLINAFTEAVDDVQE